VTRSSLQGRVTKQRIHAIVSQVIDELEHRRATGKADYVKTLADEVQRGGIAAWKALRDLLPRDEDVPSGNPTVGIGQLFIAAHKEINRLEEAKTALPVIDVVAEPMLALPGLTIRHHAANVSHSATSASPARVQSETAQDDDTVEW
jgi:hypothetical protein